jgi:hypothetical protein
MIAQGISKLIRELICKKFVADIVVSTSFLMALAAVFSAAPNVIPTFVGQNACLKTAATAGIVAVKR